MAVLPKRNVPVNQRQKAVPGFKPVEPPPTPIEENKAVLLNTTKKAEESLQVAYTVTMPAPKPPVPPKKPAPTRAIPKPTQAPLPKVEPKQEAPLQEWETYVIDSTEHFGCCSWHKECRATGDCVRKQYRIHYDTTCAQYKLLMRERGVMI